MYDFRGKHPLKPALVRVCPSRSVEKFESILSYTLSLSFVTNTSLYLLIRSLYSKEDEESKGEGTKTECEF